MLYFDFGYLNYVIFKVIVVMFFFVLRKLLWLVIIVEWIIIWGRKEICNSIEMILEFMYY